MLNETYKTTTIEDTELIYTILREKYPTKQIEIEFNDNTKDYTLRLTEAEFKYDPEVPLNVTLKVVYGDSCTGDTPLLLMKNGQVYIETIESIFDETKKVEYPGFKMFDQTIRLEKEYSLTDFKVWTDQGWINIKKVIRHKCDKKIFRVLTHTGCVDVSEDHSLLTPNLEKIKPSELNVGDSLSHSFPTEFNEDLCIVKMKKHLTETFKCNTCNIEKSIDDFYKNKANKKGHSARCKECDYYKNSKHPLRNIIKDFTFEDYLLTEKEAEVWGMFQGDGSCGSYHCKSGIKNSWALNNNDLNRLNYFKDILESVEPIKFEILDTLESSGVYKLVPKGSIKYMVDKYRPLFYYQTDCNAEGDKYKIVPNCILNASKEIKKAYWKGYYEADGAKTHGYTTSFAVKGKIGAQCMYYLMRSIGFNMYIQTNVNKDKEKYYWLNQILNKSRDDTIIKKLYQIDTNPIDSYIYDLETDIGRFNCGVGQLQGANTDSVFLSIKFNRKDFEQNRKDAFKLAIQCGDNITNDVFKRPPIDLEFEKVYQPFILLTKKRYIGKKYEDTRDPMKLKTLTTSGIAITKRNYCNMVKKCYKQVIDIIMDSSDLDEAISVYKKYIDRIDNYQIDQEDLVISAQIGKEYSCKTCKKKVEWIIKCDKCKTLNPKMDPICKGTLKNKPCNKKFECLHTFSLGHINLAQKFLYRNDEISIGDRIQFIYVENETTNVKSELTEDPTFAKNNNIKYNRGCYLEQLAKSIMGFFKVVLQNEDELIDDLLEFTNEKLVEYGSIKLKISDFKITDD